MYRSVLLIYCDCTYVILWHQYEGPKVHFFCPSNAGLILSEASWKVTWYAVGPLSTSITFTAIKTVETIILKFRSIIIITRDKTK